jgi:DNA polymerase-4
MLRHRTFVQYTPITFFKAAAMPRTIIHLDLDAFFCAVEEQRDPSLIGTPFAVGGRPEERGVVASCSYAARQFGVHSAMSMAQARRRCPQLRIVPARFAAYRAASSAVMARLHALTPLVEQISIDEAFLDVGALVTPGEQIARQLQQSIQRDLGLPCSLGVASNKLVAKIATDVGKARTRTNRSPNALCVVPPGTEAAFLAPLPTGALWGVGPRTAERLTMLGITIIGDLARYPEAALIQRFGKHGAALARHAKGLDDRPLQMEHEAKSLSKEHTFAEDVRDEAALRQTIEKQAAAVASALQHKGLSGTTVVLKLRWADFTTLTRQTSLFAPTNQAQVIADTALRLFTHTWQAGLAVRLLGVGVSGLNAASAPISLWDMVTLREEKRKQVEEALLELRARFGERVVLWGYEWKQAQ